MPRRLNPSEHQIQCAIVEWANITPYNEGEKIGDYLIAIKNEGKQKVVKNKNGKLFCPTGIRYNKEGRKKGVSDLFLAIPMIDCKHYHNRHGLWIEVKSKNGKISKEQREWALRVYRAGYVSEFVRTVDEGISVIKGYLGVG